MKYTALNKFEILSYGLSGGQNGIEELDRVLVSANGASRIQFVPLPVAYFANPNGPEPNAPVGENQLLGAAVHVNGLPLLPTVLNDIRTVPPAAPPSFGNRLQNGDRLDFNHGPDVADHTVYEVRFPIPSVGGDVLFLGTLLMVIRTFTTPVR